jgi:hypothetical protein
MRVADLVAGLLMLGHLRFRDTITLVECGLVEVRAAEPLAMYC